VKPPRLGRTTLIAVDGPSGSGKTTYAAELARELNATVVSTDDFATWDDPVAWWPRLVEGVLAPIEEGRPGRYRKTEWSGGHPHPGAYRRIEVPEVLVIEGVSAGRRSITSKLSLLVWCELSDSRVRFEKVLARDGEGVRIPLLTWQNFERGWYSVDQTRSRADVVRAGSDTESLPTGTSPPSTPRG
jgi:AAA domain-containing protein